MPAAKKVHQLVTGDGVPVVILPNMANTVVDMAKPRDLIGLRPQTSIRKKDA